MSILKKNYRLLDLCQLELTNEEFLSGIYPFLKKNPKIEGLSLDGNEINSAFQEVQELNIPALSLRGTNIKGIDLIHATKWKIEVLNLTMNTFTEKDINYLSSISNIKEIYKEIYADEIYLNYNKGS